MSQSLVIIAFEIFRRAVGITVGLKVGNEFSGSGTGSYLFLSLTNLFKDIPRFGAARAEGGIAKPGAGLGY
ncbi:hypothetical protein [Endozoicomonas sp.]|uniref:hypothetical protein n=1 Tax=Endozoicomonas sp. TaxID=1892382 RepID=UPI0028871CC0|nr:hypothetical protein [Endozoicomonas sp.]